MVIHGIIPGYTWLYLVIAMKYRVPYLVIHGYSWWLYMVPYLVLVDSNEVGRYWFVGSPTWYLIRSTRILANNGQFYKLLVIFFHCDQMVVLIFN